MAQRDGLEPTVLIRLDMVDRDATRIIDPPRLRIANFHPAPPEETDDAHPTSSREEPYTDDLSEPLEPYDDDVPTLRIRHQAELTALLDIGPPALHAAQIARRRLGATRDREAARLRAEIRTLRAERERFHASRMAIEHRHRMTLQGLERELRAEAERLRGTRRVDLLHRASRAMGGESLGRLAAIFALSGLAAALLTALVVLGIVPGP